MKEELFDLNFKTLLKYPDKNKFIPAHRYRNPVQCNGFCIDCERCLHFSSQTPPLMSHGCSIDEIKTIANLENDAGNIKTPVMFPLENPGGDYENGEIIECEGITKAPPVKHFYFSPNIQNGKWPESADDININRYGNYFAYLIKKYSLYNVYITNCIKCKYSDDMYEKTRDICVKKYLQKEITIFSPEKVVCFGCKAEYIFKKFFSDFRGDVCRVLHPATRISLVNIIKQNDETLSKFFNKPI